MPPSIQVNQSAHRAFGRLIRLTLDSDTRLDFTAEEAATVSRVVWDDVDRLARDLINPPLE
jgi:hypothetical protein